jgi:hypothetical protein
MTIKDWNPLVNNNLCLDGGFHLEENFTAELEFESGKKSAYLKNSYIPMAYPSVGLILDNAVPKESGLTEYQEFMKWFNDDLRYGILPFYAPRIGFKGTYLTRTGETGIYKFTSSPVYDRAEGVSYASFGLRETGYLPETRYRLLAAENGEILLADRNTYIVTY